MKTNQKLIRHFVYRNKVRKKNIYINSWTCSAGFFFILFFFIGRFVVCIVFRCALTQQIHLSSADRFTERRVDNLLCFQTKKKQKSIGLLHRFYLFNHSCGRSDDDDDATAGTKYRSSVERNKQNKTKKVTKVRIFSSSANLLEEKKNQISSNLLQITVNWLKNILNLDLDIIRAKKMWTEIWDVRRCSWNSTARLLMAFDQNWHTK